MAVTVERSDLPFPDMTGKEQWLDGELNHQIV